MKKASYFAFLCCMFAMFFTCFTACKDDDDDDNGDASKQALYGMWKSVSQVTTVDGETEKEVSNDKNYDIYTFSEVELIVVTYENGVPGEPEISKISISGNQVTIDGVTMTFSISGDTLTLSAQVVDEGEKVSVVQTLTRFTAN